MRLEKAYGLCTPKPTVNDTISVGFWRFIHRSAIHQTVPPFILVIQGWGGRASCLVKASVTLSWVSNEIKRCTVLETEESTEPQTITILKHNDEVSLWEEKKSKESRDPSFSHVYFINKLFDLTQFIYPLFISLIENKFFASNLFGLKIKWDHGNAPVRKTNALQRLYEHQGLVLCFHHVTHISGTDIHSKPCLPLLLSKSDLPLSTSLFFKLCISPDAHFYFSRLISFVHFLSIFLLCRLLCAMSLPH